MSRGLPKGRRDVVLRQLTDDWVLFDPKAHLLHVLNLTAALVWTACDGARSRDDLLVELQDTFEVTPDPEALQLDIEAAVERFRAEGLLE